MTADITRHTFDPVKHYRAVRMQQGRVQLDADWNEQLDIDAHRDETETADVIGLCGAPQHPPAEFKHFKIAAIAGQKDLAIAPGQIYVGGHLCEHETPHAASAQPDLPADAAIVQLSDTATKALSQLADAAADKGRYLVYLDVWQRHLTAIEDASIREVALGGPDTATRVKNVWQVKLRKVDDTLTCDTVNTAPVWQALTVAPTGTLAAQAKKDAAVTNPCAVSAEAGFRGLENQLYRVQVHQGGNRNVATFKWSRENGSVVTAIERISGTDVTVRDLGRDAKLGFAAGQWVEILDDALELLGQPGELLQIDSVDPATRVITLKTAPAPLAATPDGVEPSRHPKLRRWDQSGTTAGANGVKTAAGWLALEDGVEVRFSTGTYRSGDYWIVPARIALGDVEWPRDPGNPNNPKDEAPRGIGHDYCALAIVNFTGTEFEVLGDCRKLFPPLTELIAFFYVSGDGQEARPGHELSKPLQVGVANGQWPVAGRKVRFTLGAAGGKLLPGTTPVVSSGATEVITRTGADGVAECRWQLDTNFASVSQRVEARLIDDLDATYHLPVRFNANLSIAGEVAYATPPCETLPDRPIPTVRALLKKKFADWPALDSAGNTTAKEILDAFLCRLDAGRVPYDPTVKADRWKDIKESDVGSPPTPDNVQDALDQLIERFESSDIFYRPDCGTEKGPTVRALLKIPNNKDSKINEVLDKLLCEFNASHLPIAKSEDLCETLRQNGVRTTQDALQALCARLEGMSGISVPSGQVVFKGVAAGQSRSSPEIRPALRAKSFAVLTAIEVKTGSLVYMGDLNRMQFPSLVVVCFPSASPPRFVIDLKDNRPAGASPITWTVRWWAISGTAEARSVTVPAPTTGSVRVLPELVLGRMLLRPGATSAELAADLGLSSGDLTAAINELREGGLIRVDNGRLFVRE